LEKFEIRISKSETNSNFQNSNFLNFYLFRTFEIWSFEIVSNFGFRASDLKSAQSKITLLPFCAQFYF